MKQALGIIEVVGKSTAVTALDAACKAADVYLIGTESIIGSGGSIGINIQVAGEVAAVNAAIDAAEESAMRVGQVIYKSVIPRPHEELDELLKKFNKNLNKRNEDSEKTIEKNSIDSKANQNKETRVSK